MIQAVRWATGDQWSVTVKQAPRGLLIKAFCRKDNGLVVHLLNCRADSVKCGEVVPASSLVDFPSQEEDIRLEVRLSSVRKAYLISPDWEGKKPAKVNRASGKFRITIPAHTLKRYAVLYISTGKI